MLDKAHNYLQKYLEDNCMFYYLHPIVFLEMDKDIFLLEQFLELDSISTYVYLGSKVN